MPGLGSMGDAGSEQGPPHDRSVGRHARASRTTPILSAVGQLVVFVASVSLGAWVYLQTYVAQGSVVPLGSDTTTYIWRARVVGSMGLAALPGSSPFPFQSNGANPDRVGLLVLSSVFRSVVGVGAWRLMWVLPALAAILVAAAAWAFARAQREPAWAAPVYAVLAATSASFAVTARGYFDNLLAAGMLVAVGAVALLAADRRPGIWAGILLLSGGFVTHWVFGLYLAAVLIGFAVTLLPESIALHRREETGWLASPSGRVGSIALGSAVVGGGLLLALPGSQHIARGKHEGFARKLARQLPVYRLPFLLPAAGVGAALLAVGRERMPRVRGLLLQLVWLAPVGVGAVLFARGGNIPMQRFLGFAFPLALLAAAGFVGLGRLALMLPRPWAFVAFPVAAAIAVGGVAWSVRNAQDGFAGSQPMMEPTTYAVLRTAANYLTQVRADAPVVVVVDGPEHTPSRGMIQAFRRVRAVVPGPLVSRTVVYLGDPDELLAGRRTTRPTQLKFDNIARTYWARIGPYRGPESIVLVLQPFHQSYGRELNRHPEWEIAPGVLLARGPAPTADLETGSMPARPPTGDLVGTTVLLVLLLLACGIGWSASLLRVGWIERVALAPVLGAAAVTVFGLVIARAGFAMRGAPMVTAAILAAGGGWAVLAGKAIFARRRAPDPEADPATPA
ncbi:MAG: hypothetical protein ACRDG8_04915 [Actinomycetota bacterium]